jgi:XRE family transcriptional regulator, regulator of sulfur utilization
MRVNMPPAKGKPTPVTLKFGAHIRKLRYAREWTQEDLAEHSGLNPVQISHLERGRNEAKISTILRLAKAFGITAGELLKPFR